MDIKSLKILFIGLTDENSLEKSYARAATNLGHDISFFNPRLEILNEINFPVFKKKIADYFPFNFWVRKMNRRLIVKIKVTNPNYLFVFQNANILPSTYLCLKVIQPELKIIWIWPDTLANINTDLLHATSLFDMCMIYSKNSIEPLSKIINKKRLSFLPLAGDQYLHKITPISNNHLVDISFVGGWRPEREYYLDFLCKNFKLNIEIHGPLWLKKSKSQHILKCIKSEGIFGLNLAKKFNTSFLNINIIDDLNFPAANMRFFEILISGGLQLCSECPEFNTEFIDGEDIFYFKNENELMEKTKLIFSRIPKINNIRESGYRKVIEKHTYNHRFNQIIQNENIVL